LGKAKNRVTSIANVVAKRKVGANRDKREIKKPLLVFVIAVWIIIKPEIKKKRSTPKKPSSENFFSQPGNV
jgi:hypothetical protein